MAVRVVLLVALCVLSGCAVGLQQAAVLPWVHGGWAFSGTDLTVKDVGGGTMPVHIAADSGAVQDIGTVTQLLLAADLPFARVSIAPALMGNRNIEFIQFDMLYKHIVVEEAGRRWWLMGGIAGMILNSGVSFTSHPSNNVVLAGHTYTPDDTINYTARRDASGMYAAVGAQVELTGWCHGYIEALIRLTHSETPYELITMNPVDGNTAGLDITKSTANLTVERQLQGTVRGDLQVPAFLLAVGIQFNLPSYHVTRRFLSYQGGDPALDDAPPEPVPPPEDATPADASLSNDPTSATP